MKNQIDMTVTCIVIYRCDEVETSMPSHSLDHIYQTGLVAMVNMPLWLFQMVFFLTFCLLAHSQVQEIVAI